MDGDMCSGNFNMFLLDQELIRLNSHSSYWLILSDQRVPWTSLSYLEKFTRADSVPQFYAHFCHQGAKQTSDNTLSGPAETQRQNFVLCYAGCCAKNDTYPAERAKSTLAQKECVRIILKQLCLLKAFLFPQPMLVCLSA